MYCQYKNKVVSCVFSKGLVGEAKSEDTLSECSNGEWRDILWSNSRHNFILQNSIGVFQEGC